MRLEGRLQLKQTALIEAAQTSGSLFLEQRPGADLDKSCVEMDNKEKPATGTL